MTRAASPPERARPLRELIRTTGRRRWALGRRTQAALLAAIAALPPACALRARPTPAAPSILELREGLASWYGEAFHGKATASGVPFDMHAMVAAHPSYPFGTVVRVTHLGNGRSVDVQVLDRGPAQGPQARGVVIDLSLGAARALGFVRDGLARVRLEVLRWGE